MQNICCISLKMSSNSPETVVMAHGTNKREYYIRLNWSKKGPLFILQDLFRHYDIVCFPLRTLIMLKGSVVHFFTTLNFFFASCIAGIYTYRRNMYRKKSKELFVNSRNLFTSLDGENASFRCIIGAIIEISKFCLVSKTIMWKENRMDHLFLAQLRSETLSLAGMIWTCLSCVYEKEPSFSRVHVIRRHDADSTLL